MPGEVRTVRRPLVGTSTKMYFDYAQTQTYAREVARLANADARFPLTDASGAQALDIFVLPDFVSIVPIQSLLHTSTTEFWVGAQDTFDEDRGAYTGEVSPVTLAQAGCRLVEIGHAERRARFGETDAWVARKAAAIVRHGMTPLVCVGEKSDRQDVDAAVDECWAQVRGVFDTLAPTDALVLAYEPVWAIGQAEAASAAYIVAVTTALRTRCLAANRARPSSSLRLLYGGAARAGLFEHIHQGVDGLFLGRFAHDPAQFLQTVYEVYTGGTA